mmetsp:Transcript_168459/g.541345  ORF Transcript_168459/g.541345 Transcript_168459/m.541345 type:complete len:716 (+) Transcript_168459:203-2350(+)
MEETAVEAAASSAATPHTAAEDLSVVRVADRPMSGPSVGGSSAAGASPEDHVHELLPSGHSAPLPSSRRLEACPVRAKRRSAWGSVVKEDMKLMSTTKHMADTCHRQGSALVFTVSIGKAKRLDGFAYELAFPDNIVADEPGAAGAPGRRSTLQLFAVLAQGGGGFQALQPLGPPHADHKTISDVGDGAFSHWREPLVNGPSSRSHIRFSMPENLPLSNFKAVVAVVFPMAPPIGWVEFVHKPNKKAKDYDSQKRRRRKEIYRELYFESFHTVGVQPELVDRPSETRKDAWYLWRVSHHDEFDVPLNPGELYEKQMPHQFAKFFGEFEESGATLWPPPKTYHYYENKVGLAELFKSSGVKTPTTWVFRSAAEAHRAADEVKYPVIVKDPYGYSSIGLLQAQDKSEFSTAIEEFFKNAKVGVEALVQNKVQALREARITYVDGRPFHGYWRIRENIKSASAASTRGGYQDFSFPLAEIAPFVERFANLTGVVVGGADFIWQEREPNVKVEPYCLEVSPTSDINPEPPAGWDKAYAEFKKEKGFRAAYLKVRRQWTDAMVLAVVDRYRRQRRSLFVELDGVLAGLAAAVPALKGARAELGPSLAGAAGALRELRALFFVRLFTVRGLAGDSFNTTQWWLDAKGIQYDELIVLRKAEHGAAYVQPGALVVAVSAAGSETAAAFRRAGAVLLPFLDGGWQEILPALRREAVVGGGGSNW